MIIYYDIFFEEGYPLNCIQESSTFSVIQAKKKSMILPVWWKSRFSNRVIIDQSGLSCVWHTKFINIMSQVQVGLMSSYILTQAISEAQSFQFSTYSTFKSATVSRVQQPVFISYSILLYSVDNSIQWRQRFCIGLFLKPL